MVTRLPFRFHFVNFLASELVYPRAELLEESGWTSLAISIKAVAEIAELRQRYTGPSFNDFAGLLAAFEHEAILVTGDAKLRKAAEEKQVTVHGVLWLLDELVRHTILTPAQAATSLRKILDRDSWLPQKECEKRLAKWSV
ncbi:hypothetical protein JW998_10315 [candidate division KSB1 bacterium]|nr:hypothetical protein [candidate division KSB1 bacterium]